MDDTHKSHEANDRSHAAAGLGVFGGLAFFAKRLLLLLAGKKAIGGMSVLVVKKFLFIPAWFMLLGTTGALTVGVWAIQTETPVTKRKQSIVASIPLPELSESELEANLATDGCTLVGERKALAQRCRRVLERLLYGLATIEDLAERHKWLSHNWQIRVANTSNPAPSQAFAVAPNTVVVTADMMALLSSDDELAFVIAHEMGHLLAQHTMENRSLALYWRAILNMLERFVGIHTNRLEASLWFELPYSRQMEFEADHIGLVLLARACYNVESALEVLRKLKDVQGQYDGPQHWATHPHFEARAAQLRRLIPAALAGASCHFAADLRTALGG